MNCECKEPGYCPSHNITKDRILWSHCQNGQTVRIADKQLKPPGIMKKMANYLLTQTNHLLAGLPIVSKEVFEKRISICNGCPLFEAVNRTCTHCGCYMDTKATYAEVSCPDSPPKWLSETVERTCKTC